MPVNYLAKVLQVLAGANLIIGRRGVGGGYRLARRPEEITMLEVINADTTRARDFFAANAFDVIVADTPYGIQHGSRTADRGLHRSPLDLLTEATPVWATLLRPGGALGLSWNTNVATRRQATECLYNAGLEPLESGPYLGFRHRVDQAIMRDVLVARKPA